MLHKLQLRQRPGTENKISTGMNTQVFLDGRPISASFIKIEANAKKVTKVLLEIYAHVDVDLNLDLEATSVETISTGVTKKTVKSK